jgi:hypothetical protein
MSLLSVLALTLCLNTEAGLLVAQGGKAEPTRIQFARGRDSATVRGTLRDDAQREYAFAARKGQQLTIAAVAVPARSISVDARTARGDKVALDFTTGTASVALPEDGEYQIWLKRVTATRGQSQYTITVTIR